MNYIIVKLIGGEQCGVIWEIPESWLKQNYNRLVVGAYYYCEHYNCGCELLGIL